MQPRGYLVRHRPEPRQFTSEQLDVLRDFAALVETELQRGQLRETHRDLMRESDELKRKASIDGLTRAWSRATIMELLGAELARAKRGSPMYVAMIDADHFKNVNDPHRHQAGDSVLVEIGRVFGVRCESSMPSVDMVGRSS